MSGPWVAQSDAVQWLYTRMAGSVALCITDPAYESLEKHRKVGTTMRLSAKYQCCNDMCPQGQFKTATGVCPGCGMNGARDGGNSWFKIFENGRFPAFFDALYRVMAKNSHVYVMCDVETMRVIVPVAEHAGFKFWKPLIWDKVNIGMGYHYRARYELVLFFEKGKRKLADLGVSDILTHKKVYSGYPTEKPVSLCTDLVNQSSLEGELVIDPFAGSGPSLVAAAQLGRRVAGCDLNEPRENSAPWDEYPVDVANRRISEAYAARMTNDA